jgi:glutathione synthase/RimK-type ligase-like ATP-grasp enzyme
MTSKKSVAILKNESTFGHEYWLKVCKGCSSIDTVEVINVYATDWLNQIQSKPFDLILLKPPGVNALKKSIYDERAFILKNVLNLPVYPSLLEVFLYENKRFLRDWLVAKNIPHPETNIFFAQQEATKFIKNTDFLKIVGKTNIGASGIGVVILKSKNEAFDYVNTVFNEGVKSKSGPKLFKGSFIKKLKKLTKKGFISSRLKEYKVVGAETQKDFVILQKYIPHEYEWRCVIIGDSFFAHKKILVGDKSSGTLKKGYDEVPKSLLDFMKKVSDEHNLKSVAIDIFDQDGTYLINEIQCFFGQSDPYQMLVDGKPGRYIFKNDQWSFEEGMFNTNECYDLRLEHALSLL